MKGVSPTVTESSSDKLDFKNNIIITEMLSTEKLKLFVEDMCVLSGEKYNFITHQQISDLARIVTATGCGSWPFNTADQNFIEYMSALAVAVSHLFKMPAAARKLFVENGLANVGLKTERISETLSSWTRTHLDSIDWVLGNEYTGHIIYRPVEASMPEQEVQPEHQQISSLKSIDEKCGLKGILLSATILHRIPLLGARRFGYTDGRTPRYVNRAPLTTDYELLYSQRHKGNRVHCHFQQCRSISSESPPRPQYDHDAVRIVNVCLITNEIDKLLFDVTCEHLPTAIYHDAVPFLMSALPVSTAAVFTRYNVQQFCKKFSSKMKTTLTFLSDLVIQTMSDPALNTQYMDN